MILIKSIGVEQEKMVYTYLNPIFTGERPNFEYYLFRFKSKSTGKEVGYNTINLSQNIDYQKLPIKYNKGIKSRLYFNGVSSTATTSFFNSDILTVDSFENMTVSIVAKLDSLANTAQNTLFSYRSGNEYIELSLHPVVGSKLELRGSDMNIYRIFIPLFAPDIFEYHTYTFSVDLQHRSMSLWVDGKHIDTINLTYLVSMSATQSTIGMLFDGTDYLDPFKGEVNKVEFSYTAIEEFSELETIDKQTFNLTEETGNNANSDTDVLILTNTQWVEGGLQLGIGDYDYAIYRVQSTTTEVPQIDFDGDFDENITAKVLGRGILRIYTNEQLEYETVNKGYKYYK